MRDRRVRAYVVAQVVAYLGDYFYIFAIPWILVDGGTRASQAAFVLSAAAAIPGILHRRAGNAITRAGAAVVQLWGQVASVVAFLAGAGVLIAWTRSLLAAGIVTVLVATITQFARPAGVALLPDLIDRQQLRQANTVLEYGNAAAGVSAPVLASLLVAIGVPAPLLLVLCAVSAIPLVALLWTWHGRGRETADEPRTDNAVAEDHPTGQRLPALLIVATVTTFAVSSFSILIPALVADRGALATGLLFGAFGAGLFVGGPILRVLRSASDTTVCTTGLAIMTIGDIMFAAFAGHLTGVLGLALAGSGMMLTRVGFRTLFQTVVPRARLGPVLSARMALSQAARPASLVAAGTVIALSGPASAVAMFAVVLGMSAVLLVGSERFSRPAP